MNKFGKIKAFIESMDVEEVNKNVQALLLVEDVYGGSGTNELDFCLNYVDCSGQSNGQYCTNTGIC